MTENKTENIIHKVKVYKSTLFIPLAIPLFLLVLLITKGNGDFEGLGAFGFLFLALIYGAIIWIPTIGLCLFIEAILLSFSPTKNAVIGAFVAETILASLIIPAQFGLPVFQDEASTALAIAIVLTQLVRWWYLVSNKKMFQKEPDDKVTDVLDDLE